MSHNNHRILVRQAPNKTAMMVLMKCILEKKGGGVLGAGLTDWPTKKQKADADVGCNNNGNSVHWGHCMAGLLLLSGLIAVAAEMHVVVAGCHNYGRRANILFTFGAHCRQAATTAAKATAATPTPAKTQKKNKKKGLISRAPPTRAVSHMCVQFAVLSLPICPRSASILHLKLPPPPSSDQRKTLPHQQFSSGCLLLPFCTVLLLGLHFGVAVATGNLQPPKKSAESAKC